MTITPSGRYFKLDRWKLAKYAEHGGLVKDSSRTVFIDSSISDSFVLDSTIESSQVATVLTFQVLEYHGVGGRRLQATLRMRDTWGCCPIGKSSMCSCTEEITDLYKFREP